MVLNGQATGPVKVLRFGSLALAELIHHATSRQSQ